MSKFNFQREFEGQGTIKETIERLVKIYGDKLKKVILYGSYAKQNYDDDSDIDMAILVDLDKKCSNLMRKS